MSIPDLREEKQRVQQLFSRVESALDKGTITKKERDALLLNEVGTVHERMALSALEHEIGMLGGDTNAHRAVFVLAGFFVAMIALFGALFYTTGGITGAVILEYDQTLNTTTSFPIALNGTTSVTVIGTAEGLGDVTILLEHNGAEYILATYEHGPPTTEHASLAKRQYEEGEIVTFTAENLSSAWLMTTEEAIQLGNKTTLTNLSVGEYTLKLIINDTELVQEELPFSVVPVGTEPPSQTINSCGEACAVNLTGNATIRIEIDGATFTLDTISLDANENSPPELIAEIPDIQAQTTAIIDLTEVFVDPDGDELFYSSSHHVSTNETIINGTLTITGDPGTYTYIVYASDLEELTPSNMFTVTLGTINVTVVEPTTQNTTTNETTNTTPSRPTQQSRPAVGCNHPDVNRRPVECLQNDTRRYFPDQTILIQDTDRRATARISPIGNLLVPGEVFEQATFTPESGDYTIGYENAFGDTITTIWFESSTGNVYLTGQMHEEQFATGPSAGDFVLKNNRGVILVWANPQTGDLYLRGNIVPGRGDIR